MPQHEQSAVTEKGKVFNCAIAFWRQLQCRCKKFQTLLNSQKSMFPTEIHNFLTALFFFQSWSFVLMPWSFVMMYISNIAMWCGFAITWRGSVLAVCEVVVIIRGFVVMCCVSIVMCWTLPVAWCVYVFVVRFFHYVVIKWRDKDSLLGGPYCKLLGNQ